MKSRGQKLPRLSIYGGVTQDMLNSSSNKLWQGAWRTLYQESLLLVAGHVSKFQTSKRIAAILHQPLFFFFLHILGKTICSPFMKTFISVQGTGNQSSFQTELKTELMSVLSMNSSLRFAMLSFLNYGTFLVKNSNLANG